MKPFSFKKIFYISMLSTLSLASIVQAAEKEKVLSTVPRSLTSKLTKEDAVGLAAKKLPNQFIGQKTYDPSITAAYRKQVQEYKGTQRGRSVIEHCEAILPMADKLKNYIANYVHSHPEQSARFLMEIKSHIADSRVSPLWIWGIHLRFAAAISVISADEKDLLLHVVNPHIFTGLITDQAWNDHFSTLASMGFADDRDQLVSTSYSSNNLHWDITNEISTKMVKYFPIPTYYPLPGVGKFGLSFLVARYLENVYPMALPKSERLKAHGCDVSKVSFIVHDGLHGDVDPRRNAVKQHIYQKADEFVGKGGAAKPFIEFYTEHAVYRYVILMSAFQDILYAFQAYLLPYYGESDYKKAMAGFYLPIHELLSWSPSMFDQNDLDVIITSLVNKTKEGFLSEDVWESPFDPLKTSPLDGKSMLSDEEIIEYAIANGLVKDTKLFLTQTYFNSYPHPDKAIWIKEKLLHEARVVPSARFIDVEFDMITGQSLRITYPTLYHKWHNMDDSRGLLKSMAGIDIAKPDITCLSVEDSRQVAEQLLVTVRTGLLDLLDDFKTKALFFSNAEVNGGRSIRGRYFRKHFKHYQQILPNLVPSKKAVKG